MFACPLSTRETVMWETPAVIATWRILGRSGADRVLTAPPSRSWACLPRTFIMPDQTGSAPQRGPPDRTGPGSSGRGGPGVSGPGWTGYCCPGPRARSPGPSPRRGLTGAFVSPRFDRDLEDWAEHCTPSAAPRTSYEERPGGNGG